MFQRSGERHRGDVRATYPNDRGVQLEHGLLGDRGSDLGAGPIGPVVFVNHDRLPGLAYRDRYRVHVQRGKSPDVHDLNRDVLVLRESVGGFQAYVQ